MADAAKNAGYRLVIVESPAKAKTIEKFLGNGYRVVASNGHLIDLPKSKIGVDIENDFEPNYIVIRGRTALLNDIKKQAKAANGVYLATDPDREGEAISWHIAGALGLETTDKCRIEFNEITERAVTEAIKNPRSIDVDRVNAQQARRVLDRLVGYKLSPLLWKKVRRGLSAGRVQSVAVRLVVDREQEIRNFEPEEYWTIAVVLKNGDHEETFEAKFTGKDGKKVELKNEEQAMAVVNAVKDADFVIKNVKLGTKQRKANPPFTTSTMQQEASRKLGFTTSRTMAIAQGLYEGVKVSATNTVGLITYMRTDSTRVSEDAQKSAREYIAKTYGKEYVPEKPNIYGKKKGAQDAHEAIRPTYIKYTPEKMKDKLTAEQLKLYTLIYSRFIASQMTNARYDTFSCDAEAAGWDFHAASSRIAFPGCLAAYHYSDAEEEGMTFPDVKTGDICRAKGIDPKQNFTAPPQRYTEASLVRALEEKGIGRPSTYAPTISTIINREYISRAQKSLVPTDLGELITEMMKKSFADIVDVEFTAQMEDKLDNVENEGEDWKKLIRDFYGPFEKELEKADEELEHIKVPDRPAGIICDKCGAEMVYKTGRFGEFIACPNYPTCKNTLPVKKTINTPCPLCGGKVVQKKSKKGKTFFGCDNYPECNFVSWDMPLEEKCPKCGAYMVLHLTQKAKFKRCSNEECETNKKRRKSAEDDK